MPLTLPLTLPASRRTFHAAAAGAAIAAVGVRPAAAADADELGPAYPRMLQEVHERKLAAHAARVRAELEAVDSPETAAAHAADLRRRIASCFGPKPPRTPLNARTVGTLDRDGYRVERLTYESRPGLLVTANLYLPSGPGPHPGGLGVCGHAQVGKAEAKYQAFAVELAAAGFATLLIDPIGQGERGQWDDRAFGGGVGEHNQLDRLMRPTGEWFGSWRAWDGVRGLDLLEQREEVSTAPFLGVTGNSGGGTLTCLVAGWDDRITAAAPGCFVTTFARNLRNELPADAEQVPPGALAAGLDHHSFLVPTLLGEGRDAPGTVAVLAKRADFFDVRGTREAYGRLAKLTRAASLPARRATLTVAPGVHGYDPPLRRALVEAFCRAAGRPVPPPFTFDNPEPPEALFATPTGSAAAAGSKPVWALFRDALPPKAEREADAAAVRAALALPEEEDTKGPPPFDLRPWRRAGGLPSRYASRFAVRGEPGVVVPVLRLQDERMDGPPPVSDAPAVLLVSHRGADAAFAAAPSDPRHSPFAETLPGRFTDAVIYGCDVRGTGATAPGTVGPDALLNPYGSNYMYAAYARMWGAPTLGGRVADVLAAWRFVTAFHPGEVHLCGDRWGSIPAALAAVLLLEGGRKPTTVTLSGLPPSWRVLVEDDRSNWPAGLLPSGVLRRFDLPDVLRRLRAALGEGLRAEDEAGPRDGAV